MKIGFLSLGCPKNLVDGEGMLGIAQQAGHEFTTDAAGADVLVVNTCAFIDSAKQESIDAILEMAQMKKDGSCSRLVVTGCLAERYREELKKEIPEIDAVLGTGEVDRIVAAIGGSAAREFGSSGVRELGSPVVGTQPLAFHRGRRGQTEPNPQTDELPNHRTPELPNGRTPELPNYLYDADTPRLLTTPKHFAYVKVAEGCD